MTSPIRVALVGTGNVASRLAEVIDSHPGYSISVIASRNIDHARELADKLEGPHPVTDNFSEIAAYAPDVVLISVADNALPEVVSHIGAMENEPLVLHTSGTLSRELLLPISCRTGVLYPLQTFSKGREIDIRTVPVFTEAHIESDFPVVDALAGAVSSRVEHTSPSQRKGLHIAGVFTNNFTNILLEQVQKILAADGYGLDVVRPLIEETVDKAFAIGPHQAQTGPARRGDMAVIQEHIARLPKELKGIYASLSDLIYKSHHE